MNTKITYYYQDWGGTKTERSLVLKGFNSEFVMKIKNSLKNGEFFIANQVGFPELFFWLNTESKEPFYPFNPCEDHPWHQIGNIEKTQEEINHENSLEEILQIFTQAEENRWDTSLVKTPNNQGFEKPTY